MGRKESNQTNPSSFFGLCRKKVCLWGFRLSEAETNLLGYREHGVKVTGNVAQCALHHVTYASTKFEAAMLKGLGGDAFIRKYII